MIDRHYNPEKYQDEVKVDPQDFSALFDEYTLRHKVSDVRAKNNQVLKRAVMRFELFPQANSQRSEVICVQCPRGHSIYPR